MEKSEKEQYLAPSKASYFLALKNTAQVSKEDELNSVRQGTTKDIQERGTA